MAREVCGAREDAEWYVPEVDDNREDENPFRVFILPMLGRDLKKLEHQNIQRLNPKKNKDALGAWDQRQWEIKKRVLVERVLEVEGYAVRRPTGEVFRPRNGKELWEAVLMTGSSELAVIEDIFEAIQDMSKLEEGLKKNSSSPSDSSSAETASDGGGAAQSAKETTTQTKTTSGNHETATVTTPIPESPSPGLQS